MEAARVRPVARTAVVASAAGEVEVRARARGAGKNPVNSATGNANIEAAAVSRPPVVGDVVDGPLTARITYLPSDSLFRLRWSVRAPGELVHSLTGDGRLMVVARSSDPRVTWEIPALEYELPELEGRGFPWRWILGAAVTGAVGWEMLR